MTNDKGILIKNIYYMLSYAFQVLKQGAYEEIAAEHFNEIDDLFAAILSRGVSRQLKQGLYREYIVRQESLSTMRGKLKIDGTIRLRMRKARKLSCEFDELSENNLYNQILKTTMAVLLRLGRVQQERKTALKRVLACFDTIDEIKPELIEWNRFVYHKSNKNYEMLLNICYFVLSGMLQTTDSGIYKMASFTDEHMARLYEKFVLEYYRYHYPQLQASPAQVKWDLPLHTDERVIRFLPIMQTDITLRNKERTLIIDTKYYGQTMQVRYDAQTFHSGNLYQIFTYVNNEQANSIREVSGMLLYAKTNESVTPDAEFVIGSKRFAVKTLDLNRDFSGIAQQLNGIVTNYLS